MSPRAIFILRMFRAMRHQKQFDAGWTMGYYRGCEWSLDEWERCYLRNILNSIEQGGSA